MTALKQIGVVVEIDSSSDAGLHSIQCCMVLHHNEVMVLLLFAMSFFVLFLFFVALCSSWAM